jgi:hypothetical protein
VIPSADEIGDGGPDIGRGEKIVRLVPQADIVHTPNTIRCRALGRRLGVVRPFGATKDLTNNSLIARVPIEFNFC